MHGPASEGAAISASEVTSRCGTASSSWWASDASKIVATIGTSSSRWRTSSASRSGSSSLRRDEADDVGALVGERVADRGVVGLLAAADLGPALLERRAHLHEQVAEAGEQHVAWHGRSVPGVAFRR